LVCSAASSEAFVEASSGENPATRRTVGFQRLGIHRICASLSACVPASRSQPVRLLVGFPRAYRCFIRVSGSEAGVKPGRRSSWNVCLVIGHRTPSIWRLVKERSALRNGFRPLALSLQQMLLIHRTRVQSLGCPCGDGLGQVEQVERAFCRS